MAHAAVLEISKQTDDKDARGKYAEHRHKREDVAVEGLLLAQAQRIVFN